MAYDSEQKEVIRAIKRIGRKRYGAGGISHAERVKIKANLETGAVETDFRNLKGGDADSAGYRQERASLYPNPTNLQAAVNRFYDEADQLYKGQRAGQLAADVQRPAAQYRSRYGQHSAEAKALLRGTVGTDATGGPRDRTTTLTSTVPDTQARGATRRTAALSYLQSSDSPDALLNLATSLRDAVQTTTTRTVTKDQVGGENGGSPAGDGGYLGKVEHRANRIDKHRFPYQWGGGHNAATQHKAIPLDCSGAVSKVLGLDPRVASQFKSFGRSGKGKHITIYAKDDHVLMSINGKFWGTSGSNPGGGAGWIPASAVSSSYLSGFVARHPKGL